MDFCDPSFGFKNVQLVGSDETYYLNTITETNMEEDNNTHLESEEAYDNSEDEMDHEDKSTLGEESEEEDNK